MDLISMKKRMPILLFWFTILLCSCSEIKTKHGGLQVDIIRDVNTPNIGKLAVVYLNYTEATENGQIISRTGHYDPRASEMYVSKPQFSGDLQDALSYLSEGDSAVVKVRLDSLRKYGYMANLQNDSSNYIVYTLNIQKVINHLGQSDSNFLKRAAIYKKTKLEEFKTNERQRIEHYLNTKKLRFNSLPSGLLIPKGMILGNNAGKKCGFHFELSSLDGKIFQSGFRQLILPKLNPSSNDVHGFGRAYSVEYLPGIVESVNLAPKGKKITVILPSNLAFGATGSNNNIHPFTPLICSIEVLDK